MASLTIAFGLVAIPVKLYSATVSSERLRFHLLHAKDGSRLKQQYVCLKEQEVVGRDEIAKGYELAKDQYVMFTAEELQALEEAGTHSVVVSQFVPLAAVDPVYFVVDLMPALKASLGRSAAASGQGGATCALRHAGRRSARPPGPPARIRARTARARIPELTRDRRRSRLPPANRTRRPATTSPTRISANGESVPVPHETAHSMVRDGKLILSQSRFEHAPKVSRQDLESSSDHSWRVKADRYWDGQGPQPPLAQAVLRSPRPPGAGVPDPPRAPFRGPLASSLRHPAELRTDWNAHCAFGALKFAPRQNLAVVKRLVPDGPTVAFARSPAAGAAG